MVKRNGEAEKSRHYGGQGINNAMKVAVIINLSSISRTSSSKMEETEHIFEAICQDRRHQDGFLQLCRMSEMHKMMTFECGPCEDSDSNKVSKITVTPKDGASLDQVRQYMADLCERCSEYQDKKWTFAFKQ